MKKLMIAAAVVCAAALSQAASFTWSTADKAYMPYAIGDIKEGPNQKAATSTNSKSMSNWADAGATYTYLMLINGTESSGSVDFDSRAILVSADNAGFVLPADESTKNIAWDIVITGEYTDSNGTKWTMVSNHITGDKDFTKNSMPQINTDVPATWTITAEAVPEPTSAMLLLLGVAGLALKRKRA